MRADWVECTFGEIIYFKNGFAFKSSDYINDGIPIIRIGDISQNQISIRESKKVKESSDLEEYLINKGDILIAMSGATTGKFGMYNLESKAYLNQRVGNIFPKSIDLVFKPFLFYLLHFLKRQIEKDAYGGAQPNISSKKIEEMKVPFIPLPEQRAIVKKIEALFSSLDAGIADLKKAQDQLKIYRQAVLKKAFEGELTNSKMNYERLSNLSTIIGDGLHGTPEYDSAGEYFFINGNNLQDGNILIKPETKRIGHSQFLKHKKELNERTVFVSINGTIGNTAFYNNEPVILGKSACYINLKEEIDKKYIRYNFKTSEFLNYALQNATGSTIKNVGLKTMREYLVPLPINLEEQALIVKEIESRLSVCDAVEQQIKDSLSQAEALRQSILKKAFEGRLLSEAEVTACQQEPDYEPAAVLLEKIKAEKEVKKSIKKSKKVSI